MEIIFFICLIDTVVGISYSLGTTLACVSFFFARGAKAKVSYFWFAGGFFGLGAFIHAHPTQTLTWLTKVFFSVKVFVASKAGFATSLALWAHIGLGVLAVFALIVVTRVTAPRAKLETLGRLGWGPVLALLLSSAFILLAIYLSF